VRLFHHVTTNRLPLIPSHARFFSNSSILRCLPEQRPRQPETQRLLLCLSNIENDNSLYVGYEKQSHRLLFMKSAIDVHESLDLRTSLLWRYPRVNIATTLQDAHIYIFKRWVIDLIVKNEKISSLRSDLLPLLAKMQWQSNLRKREGIDECIALHTTDDSTEHLPRTEYSQRYFQPPATESSRQLTSLGFRVYHPTRAVYSACKFITYVPLTKSISRSPRPRTKETSLLKSGI
jgi:hypothetical protein